MVCMLSLFCLAALLVSAVSVNALEGDSCTAGDEFKAKSLLQIRQEAFAASNTSMQIDGGDQSSSPVEIGKACDWQCYLNRYPDLNELLGGPIEAVELHYNDWGKAEGRNCACSEAYEKERALQEVSEKLAEAKEQLAQPCPKPIDWCNQAGATYELVDCDFDGNLDHYCHDDTQMSGFISRRRNCEDNWPTGTCQATSSKPKHAVVHVGPHKTGSSTIQHMSSQLILPLIFDGYEMPWVAMGPHTSNPTNQVEFATCFLPRHIAPATEFPCNEELLHSGFASAKRNMNIFITAEALDHIDSEGVSILSRYLSKWDQVTIIAVYRRHFDWLQSQYNQEYKHKLLKDFASPLHKKDFLDYQLTADNNIIPLVQKLKDSFENVVVLNYHDPSKRLEEAFYCDAIPDTEATCEAVKSLPGDHMNSGRAALEYGRLVLGAVEVGIIPKLDSERDMEIMIERIHEHQEKTLGLTENDFPMDCPSPDKLSVLLNMSLEIEKALVPSFFESPLGEAGLRSDFEYQARTGLCHIDVSETLNKPEWQDFFKTQG